MNDSKIISAFLIVLALTALALQSQNKLVPVVSAITTQPANAPNVSVEKIGEFAFAIVVYLFVVSLLDDKNAFLLTIVIVFGALIRNSNSQGNDSVLNVLFSK